MHAHYPSLRCSQLQCAFVRVGPSLIDLSASSEVDLAESPCMQAYKMLLILIMQICFKQLSCTQHFCARGGNKGSPGKRKNVNLAKWKV